MNKVLNILVFPGGTEIGLEIFKSLRYCKEVRLFSAGSDVSNHAPYVFARHYIVPSIHDSGWIEELNNVIVKNNIDYIFPAYDDIVVALVENADKLKAQVVSSPLETCLVTRSKLRTYKLFADILPVPRIYDSVSEVDSYPVFVKPDKGQGSQGTHIVRDQKHFECILTLFGENIIMEYLPGEEYTIDCFSDREIGLLYCGGRQRVRTHRGISMNSISVNDDVFLEYARQISEKLDIYGAWFFQLKKDAAGEYKLLEIAPRIAGTMAFNRVLGVNFPLLSIFEQERIPVKITSNSMDIEIDRSLVNRYKHTLSYNKVYLDLDDTLLNGNIVNTDLVKFIFQCLNKKIPVILLTKHKEDIGLTLKKHRLSEVFDQIIHIDFEHIKSKYITDCENAIFIDDSFAERMEVVEKLGILTFDPSMIELLIDERI